jgi:hypothetical protein
MKKPWGQTFKNSVTTPQPHQKSGVKSLFLTMFKITTQERLYMIPSFFYLLDQSLPFFLEENMTRDVVEN